MSPQDFLKGIDFTLNPTATAVDHNTLIDSAQPYPDTGLNGLTGKALVLSTIDIALNTPDVPDPTASGYGKWKRYLWIRKPFATSGGSSKLYAWNDELVSDVTLLKWELQTANVAALNTLVNGAVTTANAANVASTAAVTTANNASTVASTASTNATTALNTATAASVTGSNAQTTANTALTTANTAITTANAANAAATANIPVSRLIPGTTAGMMLRANTANTAVEFFTPISNYIMMTEVQAPGVTSKNSAGINNSVVWIGNATSYRIINNINNNASINGNPIATLDANTGIFTLIAGTYLIRAKTTVNSRNSDIAHMLTLKNVTANSWPLVGFPCLENSAADDNNTRAEVSGIITLGATTALALDHIFNVAVARGIGTPANLGPAVFNETYSTLEIFRIS